MTIDGELPVIYVIGTLTLLVFLFFLVLIVIEYRKRQLRHITEKLEMKHQYQNEVLQTQIEVQEQSFTYISQEIHDNVAQTLSLAKLKLYKTAARVTDDNIRESMEITAELVGGALTDLRNLSHLLNGGLVSRLTLQESVEKELRYASSVKDIATNLEIAGTPAEPHPEKKLLIFRIIQEAISNAIKHGEARAITIKLAYEPDTLLVSIADDGRGFDVTQMAQSKGLGLHNMQVRARLLGKLDVHSEKEKGTTVTLKVNTREKNQARDS